MMGGLRWQNTTWRNIRTSIPEARRYCRKAPYGRLIGQPERLTLISPVYDRAQFALGLLPRGRTVAPEFD
jgi:hypothetical protein